VLGRDLKRRAQPYSDSDVRSAIRETRLVLELIGCRYADPRLATKVWRRVRSLRRAPFELPLATPLDIRFGDLGTLSAQFIGMV